MEYTPQFRSGWFEWSDVVQYFMLTRGQADAECIARIAVARLRSHFPFGEKWNDDRAMQAIRHKIVDELFGRSA